MDWHPLLVHYPVALWPAAVVVDLAAWIRRRPSWHGWAYALQAAATLGALAAVVSGNAAAAPLRADSALVAPLGRHEDVATLALFYCLGAVLLRLPLHLQGRVGRRGAVLWIAASLGAAALVLLAAYYGGHLVYDHGAGVRRAASL